MSPWDRRQWYPSAPKRPPPAHGIKMKKTGTTWWGQRWIEALEVVLRGSAGRLARGRAYARAGRAHDLVVKGGKIGANVTGSRPTPYAVAIELTELPDAVWEQVVHAMAGKAEFAAELLAGQMPRNIGDVFRQAGASLFPAERSDLSTKCSCPDWGDPCKHVAATHYLLGEALDRDPFLLFELRGRTKAEVLDALRAARAGTLEAGTSSSSADEAVPEVLLGEVQASDYDRAREPLPVLQLSFEEPVTHGAVLRQLGSPAGWSSDASPADVLAPLVRAAAERARRIALAEPELDAVEAPASTKPRRGRRTKPSRT